MQDHGLKKAPNYTNAALVMAFVNLFPALIVIWGFYGYGAALGVGLALHLTLNIWAKRRG
ncbi:hypothetical protein [Actibacterium lipolyticum]|uniref:Uncharacterized protein n=1 Tax=Actibacterium lipolyticum TaxID=1524263 RepID=A0A238KLA5_9RHOB|nr:hypothetical protein [Actibacterium lipolyticum]SMX43533.1 hypothetical protein COL8621_02325 [Actibacterium lipolyticum]